MSTSLLSTEIKPGLYEMVGITTLTALASAILTFGVVHGARATASDGRTRLLAWFGARCYSLYLVHMPVLGPDVLAAATPLAGRRELYGNCFVRRRDGPDGSSSPTSATAGSSCRSSP
ncbi:MAG: hypothetical protein U1E30_04580 [Rhodoblastus sp.]